MLCEPPINGFSLVNLSRGAIQSSICGYFPGKFFGAMQNLSRDASWEAPSGVLCKDPFRDAIWKLL